MQKICMLVGYYPLVRGGAEYQAYLLAQELKTKYEVFFISSAGAGAGDEEGVYNEDGIRIHCVKNPGYWYPLGLWSLRSRILKILDEEKPSVIYQRVAGHKTGFAAEYCKRASCRMIWHVAHEQDVQLQEFFGKNIIKRYIRKRLLEFGIRNTDYIICQANYQADLLQKHYGRSCDTIVPNFHPAPKNQRQKRTDRLVVAWVANVKDWKQPEIFVELARALGRQDAIEFVMAGRASPRWQAYLEKESTRVKSFRFIGELSMEGVEDLLASSHLFINTSIQEGFPNTFIQAWMRGVPVISLNVDPDEVIKNNGLGFHSGKIERLISDTKQLLEDSSLREEMGRRVQEYARIHHSMANPEMILRIVEKCTNN